MKGKHILVVEDIEVNRLVLVKILKTRGATCDIAKDGREAVEMFEKSDPGEYDMILMDVQMPVMNGYQATREIRKGNHPCGKTVPIIAMTTSGMPWKRGWMPTSRSRSYWLIWKRQSRKYWKKKRKSRDKKKGAMEWDTEKNWKIWA